MMAIKLGKVIWTEDDALPPDRELIHQAYERITGDKFSEGDALVTEDRGDHTLLLMPTRYVACCSFPGQTGIYEQVDFSEAFEAAIEKLRVVREQNWVLDMANGVLRRTVAQFREALQACLHVVEKGIEVRMMDQWSALREVLPKAKAAAREALGLPLNDG